MKRIRFAIVFILFIAVSIKAQSIPVANDFDVIPLKEKNHFINENLNIVDFNNNSKDLVAKELSYDRDYYFANHAKCGSAIEFVIDGKNISLRPGEELKVRIPSGKVKITYKNPCSNKMKYVFLEKEGLVFWSQPKTKDHIFDSLIISYYGTNNLHKNKKHYKFKVLSKIYGTKKINISGKIITLKRDKRYYYSKSTYFTPVLYDSKRRKVILLRNGDYQVFRNTNRGRDWFKGN